MLEQLEIYINAQKTIANYMLAFGFIMVLLAVMLHFSGTNTIFNGLKVGCLVLGLFSLIGGYGYRKTEEKLLAKQTQLYQEDPSAFHAEEQVRMEKVVKNFPVIQWVFIGVITTSLVAVFFLKNGFVNGLLFSLVMFLTGNSIIETVSKQSIDAYYAQLLNP